MTGSLVAGGPVVAGGPGVAGGPIVVSGTASDSHTWNLVFLQLLIEELGHRVVNLGPCVPDDLLVAECRRLAPAMIVISSVNGHGYHDGTRVAARLRACPALSATPLVIGGKLGTSGRGSTRRSSSLLAAGFDAIFDDGSAAVLDFRAFVRALPAGSSIAPSAGPSAAPSTGSPASSSAAHPAAPSAGPSAAPSTGSPAAHPARGADGPFAPSYGANGPSAPRAAELAAAGGRCGGVESG